MDYMRPNYIMCKTRTLITNFAIFNYCFPFITNLDIWRTVSHVDHITTIKSAESQWVIILNFCPVLSASHVVSLM